MHWKRKHRCPECKGKLEDFGVDLNTQKIECMKCHAQFSPLKVFKDSDIVFFSKSLPQEKQKAFLAKLGFERQPVRRTPKPLLYGFLSFIITGGIMFGIILFVSGQRIIAVSPVIGSLLLCLGIYETCKDEEKPRWRRKRGTVRSDPSNT